jgi:hypothetical protein
MRLTSDFWAAAYVRRCGAAGAYALIQRRGSPEAGAIFVIVDRLDGTSVLYGPAPQSLIAEDAGGVDRVFARISDPVPDMDIQQRLERERQFDPDLWVVVVEDRAGRHFLDLA